MLDPAAYLATSSQGGGDTPLSSNLKVIAVPVLANILYTAPLMFIDLIILESFPLLLCVKVHLNISKYFRICIIIHNWGRKQQKNNMCCY